jgi:RNA polymerase sigma-70 factor (ECF subfamily)
MADADRSDEELMAAVAGGERGALDEVGRRWDPRLRSFFRKRGMSVEDAAAAAQDVFVRVMATYEPESTARPFDPALGRFSSWLFRIAGNVLQNNWRRPKVVVPLADLPAARGVSDDTEFDAPDELGESPVEALLESERLEKLRTALAASRAELSEEEARVFDVWAQHGGKLDPIARALGVSLATASRRKERVIGRMLESLKARGVSPEDFS